HFLQSSSAVHKRLRYHPASSLITLQQSWGPQRYKLPPDLLLFSGLNFGYIWPAFYQACCFNFIMLSGKPQLDKILYNAIIAASIIVMLASCTIVKNYQPDKPFVYKTNINLKGNFTNEQKANLESGLRDQLDDSMQVRKLDKLLWSVLKSPPAYDSSSAAESILYMRALLRSLGYFQDSIYYLSSIKPQGNQLRTTVDFFVSPGKQVKLDSISYNLSHPDLQH